MRIQSACFRGWVLPLLLLPARALSAGRGGGAAVVFVADSRRYGGWEAWFANLYNESLVAFTVLTVVTIPVLALLLSALMSFLLTRTGIDLKSRVTGGH